MREEYDVLVLSGLWLALADEQRAVSLKILILKRF